MVINPPSDSYAPFQTPIIPEDSAQSSEDGSGMHSPVFATGNYPGHTDNFRYSQDHLDIQHSNGMVTPQYDYGHTLSAQQPPMLDTSLELPNSSARIPFSSHYSIQSRSQMDFHNHPPVSSRMTAGVPSIDFRYSPPERRFPVSPHDQSYTRPTENPSAPDHNPSITPDIESTPSTSTASASSRPVRKEIPTVVIACRQCRARKIRCDSTRPICDNCVRRSHGCEYDEKPRRRGPDKRPGTRQRSCKKRPTDGSMPSPKRQKAMSERSSEKDQQSNARDALESSPDSQTLEHYSPKFYSNLNPATHTHASASNPRSTEPNSHPKHDLAPTYRRQSSYVYDQDFRHNMVPAARSLEREQKAWWDIILKSHPLNFIFDELSFIVQNAGNILFFINLDYVMKRLYSEERLHIQPAFIYAVLALAKLLRSSKLETGSAGLSHALEFVHQAHTAYKDAIDLHWLDTTLAEAAFILSLFEISAHPQHSPERIRTSLINLDTLIRNLSLTSIDSHDRTSCRFSPGSVPIVLTDIPPERFNEDHECSCVPDSLATQDPYHHLVYSLPWAPDWSPREIADEEIRRLCWSTLSLISDYISQCKTFGEEYPHFYVTEPANYFLLFPGEILDRLSPVYRSLSPKESVWALYCRSMLLWNFCHHLPNANTEGDLFDLASEVVVESQAIENALDNHKCNVDAELIYYCRAYVHNTRMLAAKALRSFRDIPAGRTMPNPVFKRKQAQDWLFYGEQIFQRLIAVTHHLTGPDGDQLTRRPYRIAWFMNQLSDCLVLWNKDSTLDDALRVGKLITHILDVTNELWPCPIIQEKCASLRRQLTEACSSKRIEGPIPENLALPPLLRSLRG